MVATVPVPVERVHEDGSGMERAGLIVEMALNSSRKTGSAVPAADDEGNDELPTRTTTMDECWKTSARGVSVAVAERVGVGVVVDVCEGVTVAEAVSDPDGVLDGDDVGVTPNELVGDTGGVTVAVEDGDAVRDADAEMEAVLVAVTDADDVPVDVPHAVVRLVPVRHADKIIHELEY